MNRAFPWIIGAAIGVAAQASAATSAGQVSYQPAPAWVTDLPAGSPAPAAADAPLRMVYYDSQVRIAADGAQESYAAYRLRILKPEALPAANLTVSWQPDDGPLTVHYVRLIRDGRVTDVLATTRFTVLQREAQLEQSMLTGQRTATLQVPGVQVGDEIAVALTIRQRPAAFAGHAAGMMQLPVMGMPGVFRSRLVWPHDRPLAWRTSPDLPAPRPVTNGGEDAAELTLRDPKGAVPTEGAPPRFNIRRLVEYSSFGGWADTSRLLAPAWTRAALLDGASPLKAEAAAIAARTADPAARAEAALRLVEDRVRYVFVGLDGGNFLPASADETWKRRFGDCKAKTVLLVALLRELGIDAEPALVNSQGGDGLDERLPAATVFDHAIVRATVAGKVQWLDATRLGDVALDDLPRPFRWALPLTVAGAALEPIAPRDIATPLLVGIVDIDARAGLDQDAKVAVRNIVRGDEAFAIRTKLTSLSADDADRALKSYWRQQVDWATPDSVSWRYDPARMALTLSLTGRGNPGWKGDATAGHSLTIPGAGLYPPDPLRRPLDQDQKAPWANAFPRFRCWATTIRLPTAGKGLAWSLYADAMNQRLGGTAYWRASGMKGGVVRTVMSTHNYEPEVTPAEAEILNRAIPGFNNNMSSIAEEAGANVRKSSSLLPFGDDVDWVGAPAPCSAG